MKKIKHIAVGVLTTLGYYMMFVLNNIFTSFFVTAKYSFKNFCIFENKNIVMIRIAILIAAASLLMSCNRRYHCVCGTIDTAKTYTMYKASLTAAENECNEYLVNEDWETCEIW